MIRIPLSAHMFAMKYKGSNQPQEIFHTRIAAVTELEGLPEKMREDYEVVRVQVTQITRKKTP